MKNLILIVALLSIGCATPASLVGRSTAQLTAPGVQDLHKIEVVKALDVVRDLAIDGEAAKIIPTATATLVVKAHKSIINVMRQPGWKAQALEALVQLDKDIPQADRPQFTPYIQASINIIKAVIQ